MAIQPSVLKFVLIMADSIDRDKLFDFLRSKTIAVISTVAHTNQPMSATIYFVVDKYLNFYFMTKNSTRKCKNIAYNREISLVVGTENIPVTVQIQGLAEKVEDEAEFALRMDQLKEISFKNNFIGPLFQIDEAKNEIVIYKVKPTWVRWLDQRDPNGNKGFIQILP